MTASNESCLQIFFSDMSTHGVWPMLFEEQKDGLRHLSKLEAGSEINDVARALAAVGVAAESRVAFFAKASINMWLAEWGTLANRCVSIIIPSDFSAGELLTTLAESKSCLVFVDKLADAQAIANAAAHLPDLRYIVCSEGGAASDIPILSLNEFIAPGRVRTPVDPDPFRPQPKEPVHLVAAKDRALMFYYKDEAGARQTKAYTHGELLEQARRMDETLAIQRVVEATAISVKYKHKGLWRKMTSYAKDVKADKSYIRNLDGVLAAVRWEHITGHIMAYYVPVLKGAAVQITRDPAKVVLPEYHPHVIVGEAYYFDLVRNLVTEHMRKSGKFRWQMFTDLLMLGKLQYESTERLGPLRQMQDVLLRMLIMPKIAALLGGRLRLLIGVDYAARYETQLFFHTLGVEVLELPAPVVVKE